MVGIDPPPPPPGVDTKQLPSETTEIGELDEAGVWIFSKLADRNVVSPSCGFVLCPIDTLPMLTLVAGVLPPFSRFPLIPSSGSVQTPLPIGRVMLLLTIAELPLPLTATTEIPQPVGAFAGIVRLI